MWLCKKINLKLATIKIINGVSDLLQRNLRLQPLVSRRTHPFLSQNRLPVANRLLHEAQCQKLLSSIYVNLPMPSVVEPIQPALPPEENEEESKADLSESSIAQIPCEICGQAIDFIRYEQHLTEHRTQRLPTLVRSGSVVPCEVCGTTVPFTKYQAHMDAHSKVAAPPRPESAAIIKIKCELCGEEVEFSKYREHAEMHDAPPPEELPTSEAQLPRVVYSGMGLDTACNICLLDYVPGDRLLYLPCTHQYHEVCILDWMKKSPICPICKRDILKK